MRSRLTVLLVGNMLEFNRQDEAGDLDFKWTREFGPTWRLHGILGVSSQQSDRFADDIE